MIGTENVTAFIRPELLILVPVLYFVGVAIKGSSIDDRRIPLILGGVSVLLALMYCLGTGEIVGFRSLMMALFTAITQGILIAGAAVYINQLIKQAGNHA